MSRAGLIQMKGAPVTFTKVNAMASRNRTAGTSGAPETTTVKGYALRASGDAETYRALELIASSSITLDFVPKVAGEVPSVDMVFEFGNVTYKVRSVENIAPAGVSAGARIIGGA